MEESLRGTETPSEPETRLNEANLRGLELLVRLFVFG